MSILVKLTVPSKEQTAGSTVSADARNLKVEWLDGKDKLVSQDMHGMFSCERDRKLWYFGGERGVLLPHHWRAFYANHRLLALGFPP